MLVIANITKKEEFYGRKTRFRIKQDVGAKET
jgi:hypothetical protein